MKKKITTIPIKNSLRYGLLIVLLGLTSCGQKKEVGQATQTSTAVAPTGNVLTISASRFQAENMALGKLETRDFHRIVSTNGIIDVPPQNRASVSTYFSGYVKKVSLLPGQKVKKGQFLFTLENPDYIQIQQDFLAAKGQLTYLKANYERQKNLLQDKVTSQKNYLKAEADYTVTQVRYEALKKKLALMGIGPSNLTREKLRTTIVVRAPLGGYITQVNITKGTYLQPADVAVSIVNTTHLHLELNIFEKDLNTVAVGQPITFNILHDKANTYSAHVLLVNKSVDPEKRTINVHGHITDEKNIAQFSPGMYIEAQIYTSSHAKPSLQREAVVDIDNKYYVLVATGHTDTMYSFAKKEVKIEQSSEGYIAISNYNEFEPNTEFLTKGAFNLITE